MPPRPPDEHPLGMSDDTARVLEGFASTAQVAGAERVARTLTVDATERATSSCTPKMSRMSRSYRSAQR